MTMRSDSTWALILAGGDGTRLRPLTMQIAGDDRPKQFCALLDDGETLLDRTRRRADLIARFDHQAIVVTRSHEPYYRPLATELAPGRLIVQPDNRGTAAGILYPLLHIEALAGDPIVATLPSDHYVEDDDAFVAYIRGAVDVVGQCPDLVVLLGVEPDRPEVEYGWLDVEHVPLPTEGVPAFPVHRFWEKPSPRLAERLLSRGCLWNSFVMVGRVSSFLRLVHAAVPELSAVFASVAATIGSPNEADVTAAVYARLPSLSFSEAILARRTDRLAAVRVKSVQWSDWGHPTRVLTSLARSGREPAWLGRVELRSIA